MVKQAVSALPIDLLGGVIGGSGGIFDNLLQTLLPGCGILLPKGVQPQAGIVNSDGKISPRVVTVKPQYIA